MSPRIRRTLKITKWLSILGLTGLILGVGTLFVSYLIINPDLPEVDVLSDVQLQVPLRIYSADGSLMQVYGEKRRSPLTIDQIPDNLKNAFIAGEDARFFVHPGVDYQGIARAIWHIAKTGGEKGPGGSTITQQLARDFGLVSREKLFTRKLKEWFLALKIERELSKDEILALYLNKIYLGNRAYGVAAAAQGYYGKKVDELTLAESAMIAACAQLPSRVNPLRSPELSTRRRNYMLRRMAEQGYVSQADAEAAIQTQDYAYAHDPTIQVDALYVAELARSQALQMVGDDIYSGGYSIHTTVDAKLQNAANSAIRKGLIDYDQRHGYRGPEAHFELQEDATSAQWDSTLDRFGAVSGMQPALVLSTDETFFLAYLADGQTVSIELESISWARAYEDVNKRGPKPTDVAEVVTAGDVIRVALDDEGQWQMTQIPDVQGALVSLAPEDGAVKALVGGLDFLRSKFNRATQAKRQPGSSFKPFVYAAALDRSYTTATLVNDAPIVFEDDQLERSWKPENFSEQFFGLTRLREGMVNSRNLVSIRVLRDIGVNYAWRFVQRFGFSGDDIPKDLSMALGSGAVAPLTMARAYASLANGGYRIDPYYVSRIVDGQGRVVFEAKPAFACANCPQRLNPDSVDAEASMVADMTTEQAAKQSLQLAPQALEPPTHYLIQSLLRDVVRRGTGRAAMALGRNDLAGKTGTTNDQRDAWFSGYNSALATTVWVGFDQLLRLGSNEVGGKAALPIWIDFMGQALAGVPEAPEPLPAGVAVAQINPDNGLLCSARRSGCITEYFRQGTLPDAEPDKETTSGNAAEDPYGIF
ncbi:MAG: penicillin-binding protein 1A [Lysobacterales bacterium]